jgi:hypothetical protein
MVVYLHDQGPANPPYIQWPGIEERHQPWADRFDVIVLEPMARYNSGYQGAGEQDVLHFMTMAKEQLSVDANRVYLMGTGMGGEGTWRIGSHHPELFAAIAPMGGGHDYHVTMTDQAAAGLTPRSQFRASQDSTYAQAEALLTTPVFINAGTGDPDRAACSRYAVRLMQRWGYHVRYSECLGAVADTPELDSAVIRWLLSQRRVSAPAHVRIRAGDVGTASAQWVRVEQCVDPWQMINVDAQFTSPGMLRLDTDNVCRITLLPPSELLDRSGRASIVWTGGRLRVVSFRNGPATLNARNYSGPADGKSAAQPGKMASIFSMPFAIVIGTTSPDPLMRQAIHAASGQMIERWQQAQHTRPRVYLDTDVPQSVAASCSLILVGGPADNAVAHRLCVSTSSSLAPATPPSTAASDPPRPEVGPLPYVPLVVLPSGFEIDGQVFSAENAVAGVLYPSPLNHDRYVEVLAATSPAGMLFAQGLPSDVDFAIVDGPAAAPVNGVPDSSVIVADGMFDNGWRMDPALVQMRMSAQGQPSLANASAGNVVPGH